MDWVYIPDIKSITSVSKRTIDVFATITESLEVKFQSKTTECLRQQINSTMKKIMTYRQNMVFPELDKLFYLLNGMVLGVVESHDQTASSKKSFVERVRNKIVKLVSSSNSIRPIPTFDEKTTKEYYRKVDEINKQTMTHKHIYKKLQRQKEMYLTGERKVKKYESCLKTTELSRYCNAHKLSSSQLTTTDKSIRHFQTKLNNKKQEASEIAKRYQILLTKEKTTRNALLLLEKELLDDIQFNLVERIQSGLVCLKYILASQTNKFYELLPQIDNFDCRLAAELIIAKLSSKYQFSSPNWRGVDFLVQ
ncbi:uncharacterized protein [Mytilus edulis]|uniref:uncharacterized protein n=1 Tax=Mytilus edulis TaxID=6550 RepID=UPI0039EF4DB1